MAKDDAPKGESVAESATTGKAADAPTTAAASGAKDENARPVAEQPKDAPSSKEGTKDSADASSPPSPPPPPPSPPKPEGAAWGEPVARFERRWTWFETRLITFVLVSQLLALVAWVVLSGFSSPPGQDGAAGTVFRAAIGAALFGSVSWFASRKLTLPLRRGITMASIAVGLSLAGAWRTLGVDYFDNVKGWLQEGSTLTLMGGLRGLATRLTLWLALLGASLATASGKHIHIDVIFRFLPKRFRMPAACLNYLSAALVCFAAVWGFFDHIAIDSYDAKADDTAGAKIARAKHAMGEHAFLTGKQIRLDFQTLPHVLKGHKYDRWMSAPEWNAWIKQGNWESQYRAEDIKGILVPDDSPAHAPLVISPGGEATRGMLVHDLNFVFPFGLLVIGLRLLLRMLLTLSGHVPVDPNEAHREEIGHSGEGTGTAAGAS